MQLDICEMPYLTDCPIDFENGLVTLVHHKHVYIYIYIDFHLSLKKKNACNVIHPLSRAFWVIASNTPNT
jgi:hypothetical protein